MVSTVQVFIVFIQVFTVFSSDVSNWPVINPEAEEARSRMVDTHRVVPLPVYGIDGCLVPPERYKDIIPGALLRVDFTLTHWYIPESATNSEAVNTFVADVKAIKILVDAPPLTSAKKRKTAKTYKAPVSPMKKTKKN